ncbi:MAG TPA: hypothetical protein VLH19_04540 [Patescibacteria group bacterium]|nr:hypothetical protein [Patescibacteria group bacterium]
MTIKTAIIGTVGLALLLGGCSRLQSSLSTSGGANISDNTTPQVSIAPLATSTPLATPDAALQQTPLGRSDDAPTLKGDLDNTTIVNESFTK